MNNSLKLIASQYLVKKANIGALLRGAKGLVSGIGHVIEDPFHAAELNRLFGKESIYAPKRPQDFKPGLRAPTTHDMVRTGL